MTATLTAAHQSHNFNAVASCKIAVGVFFARDQFLITFDRTITIFDVEFEQQIAFRR
jgi:hypothetical protein